MAKRKDMMTDIGNLLRASFVSDIQTIIDGARRQAVRSVDFARVQMYWSIGRRIFVEEQQGRDRADYGSYLIRNLAKEIEPEYKYDLQAFFSYFSFFNVSELAKRSHISPALMLQYSNGTKKAGEKTYARLSACVGDISRELQTVSFL